VEGGEWSFIAPITPHSTLNTPHYKNLCALCGSSFSFSAKIIIAKKLIIAYLFPYNKGKNYGKYIV